MSGKTSPSYYLILLSFMALFAGLAAYAKEPAEEDRAAVLSAVRSGNHAEYVKALERYNERLSKLFKPKEKVAAKEPRTTAVAKEIAKRKSPLPAESKSAEDSNPVEVMEKTAADDTVVASVAVDGGNNPLYNECLKGSPKECCTPLIDKRAEMPPSCGNRSIATENKESVDAPGSNPALTGESNPAGNSANSAPSGFSTAM